MLTANKAMAYEDGPQDNSEKGVYVMIIGAAKMPTSQRMLRTRMMVVRTGKAPSPPVFSTDF